MHQMFSRPHGNNIGFMNAAIDLGQSHVINHSLWLQTNPEQHKHNWHISWLQDKMHLT